jgi:hypothetical protein
LRRWAPLLRITEATPAAPDPTQRLIEFRVSGYPPTKNEAKSLLSDGHGQSVSVRALLEAAEQALAAGASPILHGRVALELVLFGPADAPSDATNMLGGIGDVLQDKSRRSALEHLGPLANVHLFTDDKQIRRISYGEEHASEPHYRLAITPLTDRLATNRPATADSTDTIAPRLNPPTPPGAAP